MEALTLIDLFYKWEKEKAGEVFLKQPFGDNWEAYTYGEVGQMARKVAAGLQKMGLKKGAHVGLVAKNCREWIIADMAIMMGGYVSVPFFPTLTGKQIAQVLELGDVDALFVGKMEVWDDMKTGIPESMPIIRMPHYEGNSVIDRGTKWEDILAENEPLQEVNHPSMDELWTIIFTSGTTGTPKGVMLNYSAPYEEMEADRETDGLKIHASPVNRFFSYLPLNHIAERVATECACLVTGGNISFTESLDKFSKNLSDAQPTFFFAVPRIWTKFQLAILAKMPQKKLDRMLSIPILSGFVKRKIKKTLGLDQARTMLTGAAPMPDATKDWYRKLGLNIREVYGMTETTGGVVLMPDDSIKRGFVGKPLNRVEARIAEGTGELCIKAPWLMEGYYKNPEKTAEVLIDGWMHTGDKGEIDSEGFVKITGRVKDAFKTAKGKYIIPAPIEYIFATNADIEQICVVGLGMPQPMAMIVPSEIGIAKSSDELKESLQASLKNANSNLANYQRISTVVVAKEAWSVENGILTPTLKVKRNVLDERYLNQYLSWHEHSDAIVWE